MKVCFDIGGVLSKYPEVFRPIVAALQAGGVEVHVVTDRPPNRRDLAVDLVRRNGYDVPPERIHCADVERHGYGCKAVVLEAIGADVHVDDFPGYLDGGCPVRLLVMPDAHRPHYAHDFWTDGTEEPWGRKCL